MPRLPILTEHDEIHRVGLLVIAGDRGLAGAFNSNAVRWVTAGREHSADFTPMIYFASGRRPASSLTFRGLDVAASFTGFTERPSYADARRIAERRLMVAYVDDEVDQVEIFYNGYISPLSQVMRRETLLPLQRASVLEEDEGEEEDRRDPARERKPGEPRALVEYEPDPEEILKRLVPDYVEISSTGRCWNRRPRARGADDRDAQRVRERQRADRGLHAGDEPRAPGGDHPGDHGSRRRRRGARLGAEQENQMATTSEETTQTETKQNTGTIEEIQGVVIEAVFPDKLPEIYHAIKVKRPEAARAEEDEDIAASQDEYLVCEVQQHLGDDRVRAVAMDTTDGLSRGTEVIDTGGPITVPVGPLTPGRIFNVLGEPIDNSRAARQAVEPTDPPTRPDGRGSRRPPSCSRPASRSST